MELSEIPKMKKPSKTLLKKFVLATHKVINLPVFQGWFKVKGRRIKVHIIPGDELVGMGLLAKLGSKLIVDFAKAEVKLIK